MYQGWPDPCARLRDQAVHQLLILELTLLGHQDSLVMGIDGLLQLDLQVLPVLPKGLDLSQSLLLRPCNRSTSSRNRMTSSRRSFNTSAAD